MELVVAGMFLLGAALAAIEMLLLTDGRGPVMRVLIVVVSLGALWDGYTSFYGIAEFYNLIMSDAGRRATPSRVSRPLPSSASWWRRG